MEFGINILGARQAHKTAQRAEELGFHHIWYSDSPAVCADLFTTMGAAAATTSRIRIGSGVCVPWSRNPVVTANGFASLNSIAPGRVDMVLGTGFSGRRCFGLRAMSVASFRTYVEAVLGLLRGEEVRIEIEGAERGVKLIHPQAVNIADPIRTYIAASGPKMKQVAAELGTRILDQPSVFASDESDTFARTKQAWGAAGRDVSDLILALSQMFILLREGEDKMSERIRSISGPIALALVHYWADEVMLGGHSLPETLEEPIKVAVGQYIELMKARQDPGELYLKIHEGHALFLRDDEAFILNDHLMHRAAMIIEPDRLRAEIEKYDRSGVEIITFSLVPGYEDAMLDIVKALDIKPPKTYSSASVAEAVA